MKTAREKLVMGTNTYDAVCFQLKDDSGNTDIPYNAPFEIDGVRFTTIEQYIAYMKCILFGDNDAALSVLETKRESRQRDIANNSEAFLETVWKGERQIVVIKGLLAQFRQNPEIKEKLLSTGDAYLVSCSHMDVIYSCGYRIDEEKHLDASKWRGRNVLGFALMAVRSILQSEQ